MAFLREQSFQITVASTADRSRGTARPIRFDSAPFVKVRNSSLSRAAFGLFCLFVFTIPWENALILPGVITISHLLGFVAFPVAVLAILERGRLRSPSLPLVLMGLFVVWGSLSSFWTVDAESSTILITSWAQNLGMVWLIWELADHRERQFVLMRAYVFGTLVSAGDTLFSYFRGQAAYYQRYAGSGFDPNDLGLLLALSLPISCFLTTIQTHTRAVWIYRLQQVVAILAIGLTSSRAALVATIVALFYLPLASVKMTCRQKFVLLLTGVIVIGSALAFLPETTWKRWGGTGRELEQGTWDERLVVWSVGLQVFQEHPVQGIGAGGFRAGTQKILPPIGFVAHNTFLSVLVEEGLVGFALFLLLLLSLAFPALRLPGVERNLWLVVLAVWAVGVSTLTWENRKPTWFLFGLLAAWLTATIPSQKRNGSHAAFA
jgi:O-antigen ligase